MLTKNAEPPAASHEAHRASFFRQSGWLMIANFCAGMLMWAVHPLAKKTGPQEYGIFGAFLAVAMCIPAMPLQMVLAQQTARALATGRKQELAAIIRFAWWGTTALCLVVAAVALLCQGWIMERWHLSNPVVLWISLPIVLFSFWVPLFYGVLQGQQNFLWLGWGMISNGIGRIAVAGVAVWLGAKAAGMLFGVLMGLVVGAAMCMWQSRSVWLIRSAPFDWRGLLRQTVPLMLGFAVFQFLFTADTMFSKAYFDEATMGFYVAAGTMSRALMWLVGPLAAVMFPRLVHSAARAEKNDLVGMVMAGTAILATLGAVGVSLVGPWLVRFIYDESFVKVAAALLPWYSGAMIPLALANVLLNNLMARSSFRIVPALCVLAVVYALALSQFHQTPVMVLQAVGVCNLLLLGTCAWFTRADKRRRAL